MEAATGASSLGRNWPSEGLPCSKWLHKLVLQLLIYSYDPVFALLSLRGAKDMNAFSQPDPCFCWENKSLKNSLYFMLQLILWDCAVCWPSFVTIEFTKSSTYLFLFACASAILLIHKTFIVLDGVKRTFKGSENCKQLVIFIQNVL